METLAVTPLERYLHSSGEPDAEYVDGEVEQRPMGEYDHSTWQQAIERYFLEHAKSWGIRVRCELRVQVSATRYRVPDVVVFDRNRPTEQILTYSPVAVFEVLSPEDSASRLLVKLDDYERMGVRNIFVVNTELERSYQYRAGELRVCPLSIALEGTDIVLDWNTVASLRD